MADGRIIIDTKIDSTGAEKGVKALGGKSGGVAKTGLTTFTGCIVGYRNCCHENWYGF